MADFAEINDMLDRYGEGIYTGNVGLLNEVFHPSANLYSATGGDYVEMALGSYLELVANRESPEAQGQPRSAKVIHIDQSGPETAFAKVTLSIGEKHFTDYLTLLRIDGEWGIIAKIFHYVLDDGG